MENGHNKTADTILYEKAIGKKSYYVVQAIQNTKSKTLFIVAAFIGKSGYKKEDLKQLNPQLYKWLRTINLKSSVNSISNITENVNAKFQDRLFVNNEFFDTI